MTVSTLYLKQCFCLACDPSFDTFGEAAAGVLMLQCTAMKEGLIGQKQQLYITKTLLLYRCLNQLVCLHDFGEAKLTP